MAGGKEESPCPKSVFAYHNNHINHIWQVPLWRILQTIAVLSGRKPWLFLFPRLLSLGGDSDLSWLSILAKCSHIPVMAYYLKQHQANKNQPGGLYPGTIQYQIGLRPTYRSTLVAMLHKLFVGSFKLCVFPHKLYSRRVCGVSLEIRQDCLYIGGYMIVDFLYTVPQSLLADKFL